ncbi:flagellar biosynthesis protein FlhF [Acidithiobacillus sp. IBUN Pt1247-S3]|uniref:flagellar biosynthesis protein FlhF n=1 Tax=Acidithiobacillus sp. IBUN Pt1247-S3 TaxID=3166642 RepID=UPI0034E5154E
MKMRRFQGSNTREVLGQIRQTLGPDAVILSNRNLAEGVEIVAAIDFDEAELTASSLAWPQVLEKNEEPAGGKGEAEMKAEPIRQELQALRALVEKRWGRQQGANSEEEPRLDQQGIKNLGFHSTLLPQLESATLEFGARDGMARVLEAQIGSLADPLGDTGIIAVLGPTGAGKTTSVAKLAAQQVLRYGPESVALFTSDTYRIAGVEQLNIYAKILGVPVEVLRGPQDLLSALQKHQQRRWIFIDTMGLSPRDERLNEQLQWLDALGESLRRFLLLPASLAEQSLDQVLQPYAKFSLTAAILSKVDEAPACGAVLEWLAAKKLPLAYLSDGQKVPEDIHALDWKCLLDAMGLHTPALAAVADSRYHEA